jgi:hypothetical protein
VRAGGRDRGLDEDGCCRGPSAPWPTFARRERKRKSAIPVGMTNQEKAHSQEWLCHRSASLGAGGMTDEEAEMSELKLRPP